MSGITYRTKNFFFFFLFAKYVGNEMAFDSLNINGKLEILNKFYIKDINCHVDSAEPSFPQASKTIKFTYMSYVDKNFDTSYKIF